jgi:hypothetical protein
MRPPLRLVSLAAVMALALPASGQLIGKVPPAPAPSPAYTPPAPPPPPAPTKPAEPEKPLPSLIAKDADGKLKRYPEGTERAAINAFGFDEATQTKIAASEARRAADIRQMVIDKLPQAVEARKTRDSLDKIKDFNEFARIKEVAAPLSVERLTDRLMRDAAITPQQRGRIDQVIKAYEDALKEEWQKETGSDILKIASLVAREKFTEVTRDAMVAMDALLLDAAPRLSGAAEALTIRPEQKPRFDATVAAIAAASGNDNAAKAHRLDAIASFFMGDLDPDQQKALLAGSSPAK